MIRFILVLLAVFILIGLPLLCGGLEINMSNSQHESSSNPVTINIDLIVQFIVAYILGKIGWRGGTKLFTRK